MLEFLVWWKLSWMFTDIMEKPQKAKMKKKSKLSEEEKREKVREALLKKKAYESRALAIVEQLLEPDIKGNFLEVIFTSDPPLFPQLSVLLRDKVN